MKEAIILFLLMFVFGCKSVTKIESRDGLIILEHYIDKRLVYSKYSDSATGVLSHSYKFLKHSCYYESYDSSDATTDVHKVESTILTNYFPNGNAKSEYTTKKCQLRKAKFWTPSGKLVRIEWFKNDTVYRHKTLLF